MKRFGVLALLLLASTAQAKELRFVAESFPPFTYATAENPESAIGPIVDIAREACENMQATCRFDLFPWRRSFNMALNGEADGVLLMLPSPERGLSFNFTSPVVFSANSFFVEARSRFHYATPKDLAGRTVVVYGPSGASNYLSDLARSNGAKIVIELSNDVILKKFKTNRYAGEVTLAMNRDVERLLAKGAGIANLKPAGDFQICNYVMGLSKASRNKDAQEAFGQQIDEMRKNGRIRKILDKYNLQEAK